MNPSSKILHQASFTLSLLSLAATTVFLNQPELHKIGSINSVSVLVNLENCNTVLIKGKSTMPPIFNVSEVFCYGFETANC